MQRKASFGHLLQSARWSAERAAGDHRETSVCGNVGAGFHRDRIDPRIYCRESFCAARQLCYDYILGSAILKVARPAASTAGELHRNLTEDIGSKSQLGNHGRNQEVHVDFFPKDYNLGELMSTVCGVHVRRWAGVGACSAEGGRRPGRIRRRAARGRCAEFLSQAE